MRLYEILGESASSGASGSGNVATVVGGGKNPTEGSIGAGFDPNGHWGIYQDNKKKVPKLGASIIKRV